MSNIASPVGVTAKTVSEVEKRTMHRVMFRLLPFLMVCYIFCFLNRINLSFAAIQMNKQIGLTPADYGLAAGLFFITYAFLEVPSNLLVHKFGARRCMARIMFFWGVIAAGTAFVKGATSFYVMRLLLGAAEAGFYPGILFYLTLWIPPEYRARNYSLFLLAIPITGIIGGPLSGNLLVLNNVGGLAGWQWLFIVEGLPSVLLGIMTLFYLRDKPSDAAWLPTEEKAWLINRLDAEKKTIESFKTKSKKSILSELTSPIVLVMALLYFSNVCMVNGIQFFLPKIVSDYGLSPKAVGYLMAIPSIVALAGMIWWGRRSDARDERIGHAAFANFVAAASLLVATTMTEPIIRGIAISIAFAATLSMIVPFWAIPGTFLTGAGAAGGIAAVSAMGVTGGFLAPYFVGYVGVKTGFITISILGVVVSVIFYLFASAQMRARKTADLEAAEV